MPQINLFETREPTRIRFMDQDVLLPDGIADEDDPLFSDGRVDLSGTFLREHGLTDSIDRPNRIRKSSFYGLLTKQVCFSFRFDAGNHDLSEVVRAWEILKPILRRQPLERRIGENVPGQRYGIEIGIHEPTLSQHTVYRALYIEGEGWFAKDGHAAPTPVLGDDLEAFEYFRQRHGWPDRR
jgi:hypothetical protein